MLKKLMGYVMAAMGCLCTVNAGLAIWATIKINNIPELGPCHEDLDGILELIRVLNEKSYFCGIQRMAIVVTCVSGVIFATMIIMRLALLASRN